MDRINRRVAVLVLWVVFSCAISAMAGEIQGKVTFEGAGLEGAELLLYAVDSDHFPTQPDAKVGPTGADGMFAAKVAAGQYFVIAHLD